MFLQIATIAQIRIDSSFVFQTNLKKYSLYIPSSYNNATPSKLLLGLHGSSANENSAYKLCEILKGFAEMNNLIVVCPDGDNGSLNDQKDFDFIPVILDSVKEWYNINNQKVFLLGFSSGTYATYKWGLANISKIAGYITIANTTLSTPNKLTTELQYANNKPFYLIHGELDGPSFKHIPLRDSLINNGACVGDSIIKGGRHNLSFSNRDNILSIAFKYVDTSCRILTTRLKHVNNTNAFMFKAYPNTIKKGKNIILSVFTNTSGEFSLGVYSIYGGCVGFRKVFLQKGGNNILLSTEKYNSGVYQLVLKNRDVYAIEKIAIW